MQFAKQQRLGINAEPALKTITVSVAFDKYNENGE